MENTGFENRRLGKIAVGRHPQLLVTDKNGTAIDFYKKLGFELRGNTEPYPNDPDLVELEMIRELA